MRSASSPGSPRPCPPPQSSPTSLSRDASRCSGLSDMRNCRVVSAMGWGPGRSGAYWTLRITKRTEFLGGEDGERRTQASSCLQAALPAGCPLSWPVSDVKSLFSSGLLGREKDVVGGPGWMPSSPGLQGDSPTAVPGCLRGPTSWQGWAPCRQRSGGCLYPNP